jgi:hypothetical protein
VTPHDIPKLPEGADMVGGPSRALAPVWWGEGDDVTIRCMCGQLVALPGGPDGHVIDSKGNVSPSIECPIDSCSWHVFARLVGWMGGLRI